VSVCWLLLFECAKSVLSGSAMCEVEGGGAAAAEEAPPWGASGCGFVAHGVECVRVLVMSFGLGDALCLGFVGGRLLEQL
jgi:hypothetical protein